MKSWLFPTATALLLASCGNPDSGREEAFASAAEDSDRIACAVEGSAVFERRCTVERIQGVDGLTLTLRAPSGGFRRLLVTDDGRGVIAADGADPAIISVRGDNQIEVAIAGDRYQLPATVKK
ncbi:hypothetical protein [Sphingosinicella rhizophila]|uniref:Lipoprotein n=1 Tax=Sphingosinicella rhizophila TaxID=3050082 RepID=A0ABU3Q289_9SPHN|nr:hypothetical protein [Sphingosinicella sp. GR2756]MDT9597530.1 hypothetical protein [Sphingosinicella sp. GR2756]